MTLGVIGLGLIGGSFAKAIKQYTPHTVLGYNRTEAVTNKALAAGVIDGRLDKETLPSCDILIVSLYPDDTIHYVIQNKDFIKKGAIVTDCGGTKEKVCESLVPVAAESGFFFIGAHPMAGIEFSGFDHSKAEMFRGASMILTPPADVPESVVNILSDFALSLGFGTIKRSNPKEHDRVIAYTSQLAHLLSSAYVQSDTALLHKGFSAGSFRDLTRVARLNVAMWTELFFENKLPLLSETDTLIATLTEFRSALAADDRDKMATLLQNGCDRKEKI
jgi:Prephenate dehydrogenase